VLAPVSSTVSSAFPNRKWEGMMLPILISVSVTPVSYCFWARAGAKAAAMISPENPSLASCVLKYSLSARFI
jgi:hypothetical protein